LYVLGLKKNLLSISFMEDKGYEVNLQRGQVFIFPEGASVDIVLRIGVLDGNLYTLHHYLVQKLMHTSESMCKLWDRHMGHLHQIYLPLLRKMVTTLPNFSLDHQGVCTGSSLGKNVKASFPSSET
jgi:hypothetical protein